MLACDDKLMQFISRLVKLNLKGQCHEIFCHIYFMYKQAQMVLLKNSIWRRYSRKIQLCAVLACAESNSA